MLAFVLILGLQANDIVVTGKKLEAVQAECVRGACTPLRDAQASIALAEAQFRKGNYLVAKRTLSAAVARNRAHAATAPKPVAALYEALATVAFHEGDQAVFRRAVAGQVDTLRAYLPAGDPAVIAAAPAFGDMWIKLGKYRQADESFQTAETDAIRAGQDRAAMLVGLRRAWLAAAFSDPTRANRMLDELARRPVAQDPGLQQTIRIVRFRINAATADDAEIAKVASEIGRDQPADPALIYFPPFAEDGETVNRSEAEKFLTKNLLETRSGEVSGIQWIDVGFWIRPDGRTAEAEILRGSRLAGWAPTVLAQIRDRRYSARTGGTTASSDPDGSGIYRVERITQRTKYLVPVGSLISRRASQGGFEILDLTKASSAPGS